MGVEPPFIYDKPSSYTFAGPTSRGFDPRAATRASWQPPSPKVKKEGPLVDFNKHPDSYLIVPYGNLNIEPMDPRTKGRVKRLRQFQLFLRSLQFLGGLGLLFSIIAITRTSGGVSWIIRVGPAVVLCHTLYGIYHLCRDAGGRSAASSASYMLFAGVVDTGLLPFFAITAIIAKADASSNAYGWSTLFNSSDMSYDVIYAFYLMNVIEGGFIVVSLCMDVCLAVIFRKIAKMPPDMNPLEDNLTARPKGRHKRNKSEMMFEKQLSNSTLATQRMSQVKDAASTKRVPFHHTRTDSADRITLYGNERAFDSRVSLRKDLDENAMHRSSLASSSRSSPVPSRPTSAVTPAENTRAPGAGLQHKPMRSSQLINHVANDVPTSWLSYVNDRGAPSPLSQTASHELDQDIRPLSPVSMLSERDISPGRVQSERKNWYSTPPQRGTAPLTSPAQHHYQDENDLHVEALNTPQHSRPKRSREPLGMNPPTPIHDRFEVEEPASNTPRQPLQDNNNFSTGGARPGMGARPSSFIGSASKTKYYGNLRSSLGGSTSGFQDNGMHARHSSSYGSSEGSGNFEVYDSDDPDEDVERFNEIKKQADAIMLGGLLHPATAERGSRKVSATTGYDLQQGYAGLGADFGKGMARRREVSGKVAEEGRGGQHVGYQGYGGIGRTEAQDGGVITGQKQSGAAGWARFRGL